MNTIHEITPIDVAGMEPLLLVGALKALTELTQAADGDIYTDAPECQVRVNHVQDAIQQAYNVLMQIHNTLESGRNGEPDEILANRMLDEAEEAFAVRSMAEEKAVEGEAGIESPWPRPVSVQDYLFWIEEEARFQEHRKSVRPHEQAEQRIYTAALAELALELCRMGFTPTPPSRQVFAETGG